MDEIDNKALNEEPKDNSNLKNWILWLQARIPSLKESYNIYWLKQAMEGYKKEMSKPEETSNLSAEECLNKYLAEFEEETIPMERYGLLHFSESFASIRVEEAKKEWEKGKQALEAKIKHLTQVINYQG